MRHCGRSEAQTRNLLIAGVRVLRFDNYLTIKRIKKMKNVEKNKSRIETPQNYEAPAIESVEVAVEKGFAGSGDSPVAPTSPAPDPIKHPWR